MKDAIEIILRNIGIVAGEAGLAKEQALTCVGEGWEDGEDELIDAMPSDSLAEELANLQALENAYIQNSIAPAERIEIEKVSLEDKITTLAKENAALKERISFLEEQMRRMQGL